MSALSANTTKIYYQIEYEDACGTDTYDDNKILINAPKSVANSQTVLFVLPSETFGLKKEDEEAITNAKLVINHGIIHNYDNRTEFRIVKQDGNGNSVPITRGDIVANRLALFRINPTNQEEIILINSTISGDATINKLICNEAYFYSKPKIIALDGSEEKVLTARSNIDLVQELDERYQKKVVTGTQSPEEYLKSGNSLEPGQIYIQVKDD